MSNSLIGGGQFTGPSPTPLGSGVSRVLGLQGGGLAGLAADPGNVVSVFVVGDTSDQLSRALQPRKWVSGFFHVLAAPNVLEWFFRAPPLASAVIEYLRVRGPAGAELTGSIGIGRSAASAAPFLGTVSRSGVLVGGIVPGDGPAGTPSPPLGSGPFTVAGPNLGFGSIFVPPWFFEGPTSIFLPPGQTFAFETATAGEDVGWSVRWREIPE